MISLPKPQREEDTLYRQWIKTQPCILASDSTCPCIGEIDPHHVKPFGGGKMGSKVSDYRCVPLCRGHHIEAEQGREMFERLHGLDLDFWIRGLYQKYIKPTPRVPRQRKARMVFIAISCECGLAHHLPPKEVNDGQFHCWKLRKTVQL